MAHADYPRGLGYFVFQLGKILKPLPKFLFAISPSEALGAVYKTWNLGGT